MDHVETAFAAYKPMWHGKGNILDNPANDAEAIKQGGLDWTVSLRPIMVGGVVIEDHKATMRDDTNVPLGIVGSRYHVVQNEDLFNFFDPVIDRDKNIYHTGGVLKGGRIVWLLAKLDASFYAVPDDRVDSYVLLASSHDGSMYVTIKHTPIRVVCWNTLSAALVGRDTLVRIKHTRYAHNELRAAHKLMGLTTKSMEQMRELAQTLLSRNVSVGFMRTFVEKLFPSTRNREKRPKNKHLEPLEMLFVNEANSLPGMQRTGWALYNATTEYIDHSWPAKDATFRSWFGTGEDLRTKAIQLLVNQTEEA